MKAGDYNIHESSDDWEAVERWENEGGSLRRRHDLSPDSSGEDYLRHMEQTIPLGRLGEPDDLARAILFLASDEAKGITRQALVMDGAQTLLASVAGV